MNRLQLSLVILLVGMLVAQVVGVARADEYSCSGTGWCRRSDGAATPFDCNKPRGAMNCATFGQQQCDDIGRNWTYDGGCSQSEYCMPVGGQVDQGCAAYGCPVGTRRICTCQAAGNYSCVCNPLEFRLN